MNMYSHWEDQVMQICDDYRERKITREAAVSLLYQLGMRRANAESTLDVAEGKEP